MTTLTEEQKEFIVTRLAMFDTPTMVSKALKEEYGIDVPRNRIGNYNAEKQANRVAKKWRDIFEATRKAYLDEVAEIPIASQSFRLRRLQLMHDAFFVKQNYIAAAQMLEQAAKEVGGALTNVSRVNGKVKHAVDDGSDDGFKENEKRATLADLIDQALQQTSTTAH